ncbi:diacylglycerol/lipid kinase family protein [Leucobacter chinensis]|uniref:diacylglycerol/lipid kinase family protein n=1 Tax=Leucobacter chinensis TaxID=2851010 RepID=UPI00350EE8B0
MLFHPLKTDLPALRALMRVEEERAGWAPSEWIETTPEDGGSEALRQALSRKPHLVFASGGDGTVRAAAEALRGTGVPLAIIPQGTGNILARNVGLAPGRTDEAVRAGFEGVDRPIDLGIATIVRQDESEDEHVFLVLAGMGLDARAIRATRSSWKKAVGWLAYIDGGLRTMIRDKPLRIHYSYDRHSARELEVYTVMIGNCGLLPGGVLLIPDARIDDGELDVVALRPQGAFAWLKIWNKIGWENGVLRKTRTGRRIIDLVHDTKNVVYLRAKKFALTVPGLEPVQLDGDDLGLAIAVKGAVDPGALVLRVAEHWSTTAFGADAGAAGAGASAAEPGARAAAVSAPKAAPAGR